MQGHLIVFGKVHFGFSAYHLATGVYHGHAIFQFKGGHQPAVVQIRQVQFYLHLCGVYGAHSLADGGGAYCSLLSHGERACQYLAGVVSHGELHALQCSGIDGHHRLLLGNLFHLHVAEVAQRQGVVHQAVGLECSLAGTHYCGNVLVGGYGYRYLVALLHGRQCGHVSVVCSTACQCGLVGPCQCQAVVALLKLAQVYLLCLQVYGEVACQLALVVHLQRHAVQFVALQHSTRGVHRYAEQ